MHRFVLTDAQSATMEPLCLGKRTDPSRAGGDNRLFLKAVLWIARTGSHLPPTFANWNAVFKRYRNWVQAGVFRRIFDAVSDDPDMEFAMVDATIVKVHGHAQESAATRSIAENHPVRPGGPLQNVTNMLKKSSKFAFFEAQRLQHERSGNVWDNAAIESFFSSLKTEV